MKPIRTERLLLRNWEDRDCDLSHRINSDERVMEYFPFRRSRHESDAFMARMQAEIGEYGYGFAVAELASSNEPIGFIGIRNVELPPALPSPSIEIGWRLAPEFWGKGYVTEAAQAWLAFAFNDLRVSEVISFAVWNNERSLAVMRRLGMRADAAHDFDHPAVPDTHPHLKRHSLYRLSRESWKKAHVTQA
ncbi:MAG: GNAT family N-acetyltransferase [Rhizobiaceae bacterium]|nr:GNAT family N-acetyltransferase [Rhizobiaceae bacterium]